MALPIHRSAVWLFGHVTSMYSTVLAARWSRIADDGGSRAIPSRERRRGVGCREDGPNAARKTPHADGAFLQLNAPECWR